MDHIETAILNCYGIREAEQNMVFAARLTQHGHTIQNMADLMDLYRQSYSQKTVENIAGLPHPTVQKFMVITVAVVGASRRFLAQITRHQNEVKYMSASLQYSNYSGHAAFAIPYGIMKADKEIQDIYKKSCQSDLDHYAELCALGIDHDSAGYEWSHFFNNSCFCFCKAECINKIWFGNFFLHSVFHYFFITNLALKPSMHCHNFLPF